ncbi:MAG: DNA starvation/stationary phase protection protein [Proteobacteria bacterium]|nr:DNA starvation/stationary phase protection protein [Pseudomonadota bacterium]NBV24119.1 DNA starvation/stationary phase protection protein [Pseudomonadota bacterium]
MHDQETLVNELKTLLADATTLYYRAHSAHWNVVGPLFQQYHELFGEIYEDVWSSLDPIAENVRKLGGFPPSGLEELIKLREVRDGSDVTTAEGLAREVLNANVEVLHCLNEAFVCANECNSQGIANFLADRIDHHEKWSWQLSSSLGLSSPPLPESTNETPEQDANEKPKEISVQTKRRMRGAVTPGVR